MTVQPQSYHMVEIPSERYFLIMDEGISDSGFYVKVYDLKLCRFLFAHLTDISNENSVDVGVPTDKEMLQEFCGERYSKIDNAIGQKGNPEK